MRTHYDIKKEVITKEIEEITCDFCKKTFKLAEYNGFPPVGLLEAHFNYGSRFDSPESVYGELCVLDICDDCWETTILSKVRKNDKEA